MPRVNGNSPGASRAGAAGTAAGRYTGGTGSPQDVSGRRSLPLIEDSSQRDVAVLPRRVGVALGLENRQRRAQPRARVARLDDLVHVAALGGHVRVGELLAILADARLAEAGIGGGLPLPPCHDVVRGAPLPTGRPPSRPKPTTMFGANVACTSKKYRSSSTARTISFMSYGLIGCPGTMDCSDSSRRSAGSCVGRSGGSSVLFCGRNVSSSRMRARHSSSLSA